MMSKMPYLRPEPVGHQRRTDLRERECVCVREREREKVCVRERVCVREIVRECERESVCQRERVCV